MGCIKRYSVHYHLLANHLLANHPLANHSLLLAESNLTMQRAVER